MIKSHHRNQSSVVVSLVASMAFCSSAIVALADGKNPVIDAQGNQLPAAAPEKPAGLLPVPDYSADFWTNPFLTGDWGGSRTDLANKGIQIGVEWNQFVQGVADGGRDERTEYGSNWDYTVNLDLMRMGVLPGALISFRAESRYGSSVNLFSGTVLPVNTKGFFPLTARPDLDVGFNITDLNWLQFLTPQLAVIFGKLDTLSGDPNEFASGRGTSQFMNANFVFNPSLALRLPYSTLGAGIIWMIVPPGKDGGIVFTNTVINTADSSNTSGFNDFDEGQSWTSEVNFTYKLGDLPGGMNVGSLYSFNQDFAHLNSRLVFEPGEGLSIPKRDSSWAVYWSAWQYLYVDETGPPLLQLEGQPKHRGVGLFSRFGFADKETNPVEWAASGGVGGRGMIPSRDNDTFGIGYYYARIQPLRISGLLGLRDHSQGFECFYNIAVTPAARLTLDLQVTQSPTSRFDTATILGLRGTLDF